MTTHNTDYPVYENAEECGCRVPDDETSEAYELSAEDHPQGCSANEDTVRICERTQIGSYCEDCSHDQGEWSEHITYCPEWEYPDDACQCPPDVAA